ncbi:gas vesicle protein GvpN [Halovivax sp.]|uniref:gas vesicle protein GvpN n=1 Tax=Halovivax sp. TaxID=1935978 RepID=UPI0025BECAD0|nr:gas vesicle protein GvpN [Halovivax sp.]
MGNGSSGRSRTVRGRKIRSGRAEKELRRASDAAGDDGSGGDETVPLRSPDEVGPDPFVATDEIATLEGRITNWLDADQPVHLIGPTGCGKTALALHAAAERGRPVVWINGDSAVDTAALVGDHAGGARYSERDEYVSGVRKETEIVRERWVDNPLSVAVREGATLVYNEFSRTDPAAHNVLLSVFEEGVLERPAKRGEDRQIDVHPEFGAILTSNSTEYAGVHEQQDALLDRFVGIHVDYYDEATEREIVAAHVDLPDDRIDRIVAITRDLREKLDATVGTRVAITAAKGVAAFEDDSDRDRLVDVFTDVLVPKVADDGDPRELRSAIESTIE